MTCQPAYANSFGAFWILPCSPYTWTLAVQNKDTLFLPHSDDFAVKYVGKQHTDHHREVLLQNYELKTDWQAKVYAGMSLK
jgi:hypothetical protein